MSTVSRSVRHSLGTPFRHPYRAAKAADHTYGRLTCSGLPTTRQMPLARGRRAAAHAAARRAWCQTSKARRSSRAQAGARAVGRACSGVSMPSVVQTSMSMARIWATIARTRAHCPAPTCEGPRHAAPMQKRVLPAALARLAACSAHRALV